MRSRAVPRVLVTRAAEDAASLAHALAEAGFQPVEAPAIERLWEIDAVARFAEQTVDADILVVTSGTIADVIATAAPRAWTKATVAAVGPATAARLEALGLPVSVVPERSTAEDLVVALGDLTGAHVVWPHGDLAPRSTLESLERAGATVHAVIAYRNAEPQRFAERLDESLPVDATTVLSGSAARRLARQIPAGERWKLGRVVVIGPTTLQAAREVGLEAHGMANPHSLTGLVDALKGLFEMA